MESPVKCVEAPANVQCDSTAKQLGRTGKYPDTFHIYHEGPKTLGRHFVHEFQNAWKLLH